MKPRGSRDGLLVMSLHRDESGSPSVSFQESNRAVALFSSGPSARAEAKRALPSQVVQLTRQWRRFPLIPFHFSHSVPECRGGGYFIMTIIMQIMGKCRENTNFFRRAPIICVNPS